MVDNFADVLADRAARSPGDPLVTFYDDATGERTELSFATYANWVAKTASLLQDELSLERGAVVAIDLPTHWLGPVWLGAAWSLGVATAPATSSTSSAAADLVVCGPAGLEQHASGSVEVVACSLLPMATRFTDPLPTGVIDFGEVVWSQPDRLLVLDPASPQDLAWTDGGSRLDQGSLLADADVAGGRVVTTADPVSRTGVLRFVGSLLSTAGAVWVSHSSPQRLHRIAADERAELAPGDG